MKQCIMSESSFDFLRELVKNVPDINVAEEQQSLDDTSRPSSPPLSATPKPSTSSFADDSICNSSGPSASLQNNGNNNVNNANSGTIRNGMKRSQSSASATATSSGSSTPYSKQNSLDHALLYSSLKNITATSSAPCTPLPFSSTTSSSIYGSPTIKAYTPNYYKEIPDSSVSNQYSEAKPSKLSRTDSAPSGSLTVNVPNTPNILIPTITSYGNSKDSDNQQQPVINFDFSKSCLPLTTTAPHSAPPFKLKGLIPSLTPINSANSAPINNASAFPFPPPLKPSNKTTPPKLTNNSSNKQPKISTPPTYDKIDICSSPLIKINYSNLDFPCTSTTSYLPSVSGPPQIPFLSSPNSKNSNTTHSKSSSASKVTGVQQSPIINIDLSNNFKIIKQLSAATVGASVAPASATSVISTGNSVSTIGASSSSTMIGLATASTLDMDEDYDDI